MKSAERYDLAKTKSTESLAEYLFTHIVKHGVIILKEVAHVERKKKRVPHFDHTYCVQGLNITTSQNSITENGNRLNSLYWYKATVRCTHLFARILQMDANLVANRRWSNQLLTISQLLKVHPCCRYTKNYQPLILPKYVLHFWYCAKKNY